MATTDLYDVDIRLNDVTFNMGELEDYIITNPGSLSREARDTLSGDFEDKLNLVDTILNEAIASKDDKVEDILLKFSLICIAAKKYKKAIDDSI